MDPWLQVLISVAVALISSNGLWVYFSKKSDKNDATTKLMLGLAHNQIIEQGMQYLDRGYVTMTSMRTSSSTYIRPMQSSGQWSRGEDFQGGHEPPDSSKGRR